MSQFQQVFETFREKYSGKVLKSEVFSILNKVKECQPILADEMLEKNCLRTDFNGLLYEQLQTLIKIRIEQTRLKIVSADIPLYLEALKNHSMKSRVISRANFVKLIAGKAVNDALLNLLQERVMEDSSVDMLIGYLEGLQAQLANPLWNDDSLEGQQLDQTINEILKDDVDKSTTQRNSSSRQEEDFFQYLMNLPLDHKQKVKLMEAINSFKEKSRQLHEKQLKQPIITRKDETLQNSTMEKDALIEQLTESIRHLSRKVMNLEKEKRQIAKHLRVMQGKEKGFIQEIENLKSQMDRIRQRDEAQRIRDMEDQNKLLLFRSMSDSSGKFIEQKKPLPKIRIKPKSWGIQTQEVIVKKYDEEISRDASINESRLSTIRIKPKIKSQDSSEVQSSRVVIREVSKQPVGVKLQPNIQTIPAEQLCLNVKVLESSNNLQPRIMNLTPHSLVILDKQKLVTQYPIQGVSEVQLPTMYTNLLILKVCNVPILIQTLDRTRIVTKLIADGALTAQQIRNTSDFKKSMIDKSKYLKQTQGNNKCPLQLFLNMKDRLLKKPIFGLVMATLRSPTSYSFQVELQKQLEGTSTTLKYFGVLVESLILLFSTADFGQLRAVIPIFETMLVQEEEGGIILCYKEFAKEVCFRMAIAGQDKRALARLLNEAVHRQKHRSQGVLRAEQKTIQDALARVCQVKVQDG